MKIIGQNYTFILEKKRFADIFPRYLNILLTIQSKSGANPAVD
jgi:hypothetical protein